MKPLLEIKQTAFTSNWKVLKIKRVLDIPITDGPHETPELLDKGIPFLSAESVKKGKLDFNLKRGYISKEDHEKYINKCKPQRDDIFMIKSGATTGNVAIVETDEEFSIWSPLALIRADKEKITSKYLYYFIGSLAFRQQVEISWSFGTQQNIGMKVIENLFISVPPLFLQEKLVKYIEGEVIKIDKLIDMKELEIKLLEQQRQSIITEAVTKGLNPNVKRKNSGVEWIGEIPDHWKLTKIKYVATLLNGDRGENYPSGNDFVDEGLPFITSHNLNNRYVDESNMKYISEERYNLLRGIKIRKNDIIYCLRGSVGKNALVTRDEGTIASSLMGIRASTNINAKFLSYILNSKMEVWNRSMLTTGSVSDNLSAENVSTYLFTFPDLNEQMEIVDYLNNEMLKLEQLIIMVSNQIKKLKEYRQALIYEAVTGKIDVRDLELD